MSENKIQYYDWIPFFKAICEEISKLAKDSTNRDILLYEKAKEIFQTDHAIFKAEILDPFSLLYALAQRNTTNQRIEYFSNAKKAFKLDVNIPTDWIFPTPTPQTPSLFYAKGHYIDKQGKEVGNNCLWNFFGQVFTGSELSESDFKKILSLRHVGFTKLSQTMFLINPKKYMPFDTQMNSLPLGGFDNLKQIVNNIETNGISVYLNSLTELKKSYTGCGFYEINLFNVLINSTEKDQLKISYKYCQVSSWVHGQKDEDYFEQFVNENAIWTGSKDSTSNAITYSITEYNTGDVVLVRRGTKNLGGIGIVVKNEYIPDGYDKTKSIKIVWLVKNDQRINDDALGQWVGFSHASEKTINKFKEAYPTTFKILDEIRKKQKIMINHSKVKYKNLILQGPPGTGKTRLAKQIAEWLIDETEKQQSLFEAIDSRIFKKEPDINNKSQIKLIQFHPSYTYEDFVRGIKTNSEGDGLSYEVENKTLTIIAKEASNEENKLKAYVLIIDEINRANIPSVLGELIYALEYRNDSVNSIYKYEDSYEICLPNNLYIIGTMNTADRSVGNIDYAIRRRFAFIDIDPSVEVIDEVISDPELKEKAMNLFKGVSQLFQEKAGVNDDSLKYLAPDFRAKDVQIGHSYFLAEDIDELRMKLRYEIKPILKEYLKDGVLLEEANTIIENLNV